MRTWIVCLFIASINLAYCEIPKYIQDEASQGDAESEALLGGWYLAQKPPDYGKAMEWFKKAADHANIFSQTARNLLG